MATHSPWQKTSLPGAALKVGNYRDPRDGDVQSGRLVDASALYPSPNAAGS